MRFYYDKKYKFYEYFNEENGFLLRSNVIENGIETNQTSFMRSFPELLDIGIMGHCHCGTKSICEQNGIDCYQNAVNNPRPNMSVDDYKNIINQCKGATFQIALGGAGDPNKHERFEEILKITRQANIIPNLTTSGFTINDHEIECISKYCGAVAVSFYTQLDNDLKESNPNTISVIEKLINAKCKTNIHYVIHRDNIKEACLRVEKRLFPIGTNAIIFLLYKPVGLGKPEKMLSYKDEDYLKLLNLLYKNKHAFKFGFDTCQTPALRQYCNFISEESLEYCEAGRFSMYINSEMKAYPCSFGINNPEIMMDLRLHHIKEIWESNVFGNFRKRINNTCNHCSVVNCHNCSLGLKLNLCGNQ